MKSLKTLGLASIKIHLTKCLPLTKNFTNFAAKENANIFQKSFSTLADDLHTNLPRFFL